MRYLKIVSYLYLVVAVAFAYDGVMKMQEGRDYLISFLFAGVAVFMFFFRMRFANRQQNRNKEN